MCYACMKEEGGGGGGLTLLDVFMNSPTHVVHCCKNSACMKIWKEKEEGR